MNTGHLIHHNTYDVNHTATTPPTSTLPLAPPSPSRVTTVPTNVNALALYTDACHAMPQGPIPLWMHVKAGQCININVDGY